jgi:hypothetical protein
MCGMVASGSCKGVDAFDVSEIREARVGVGY